jgi:hypothetical protein
MALIQDIADGMSPAQISQIHGKYRADPNILLDLERAN